MWIFDRCGSYIDSPKWLNNKRIKTNPKNNDDMCFNCVATSALNHGEKKQRLHPRQTNRTGENFFRWYQKTWKSFRQRIRQSPLVFSLYQTIKDLKK